MVFRIVPIFLLVLALASAAVTVAQDNQYVDSDTDAGFVHTVRYFDSNAKTALRAQIIIKQVIPIYNQQWSTAIASGVELPFAIFLDLMPDAAAAPTFEYANLDVPLETNGAPLKPNDPSELRYVCHLTLHGVKDPPLPDVFEYQLAMELAHCYMYVYTVTTPNHDRDEVFGEDQRWWFDGVATWMVLQARGTLPADVSSDIQSSFIDSITDPVYDQGAESLYFWETLAEMKLSPAEFVGEVWTTAGNLWQTYVRSRLELLGGNEDFDQGFMQTFAEALLAGKIPNQPSVDDLIDDSESIGALPGEIQLEQEPFSMHLLAVDVSGIEEKTGIRVEVEHESQTDTRHTHVSLALSDGLVPLSEGTGYEFCYTEPTTLRFAVSRASIGVPENHSTLHFTSTGPCEPKNEPTSCLVGEWTITGFSAFPSDPTGVWKIIFNDDGTGQIIAQDLSIGTSDSPVVVNYVIDLTMELAEHEGEPNRYDIKQWGASLEPGASAIVKMPGGREQDLTSAVFGAVDSANNQMPPPVYIACDSPTTGRIVVNVGGEYTFTLVRGS